MTPLSNNKEKLRGLVKSALLGKSHQYLQRATYELKVIEKLNFSSYFLILWDIVNWAQSQDILVGFGRGSVAGCLVAYLLGITKVDPLEHGLIFERFLNPSRISMPDIDLDFEGDRRQEVLDYIINKYGDENVAHIMTFSVIRAKSAIRDIGRVLGEEYIHPAQVDRIAKMIPSGPEIKTLEDAIKAEPRLKEYAHRFPKLFKYASRLVRTPRHISTHASGIVIGNCPLRRIVPLQVVKGVKSLQLDQYDAEDIGLLKIDILGLISLDVVKETLELINA